MSREQRPDRDDQGFTFRGPWFDTAEGAAYVRSPTRKAFRSWLVRAGIAVSRRGRKLLVAKADLDRAIGAGHRRSA